MCIYIYKYGDLSGRSPRSTLHVFQHSCHSTENPPVFPHTTFRSHFFANDNPVNPKGGACPDSLDSHSMNLLMPGNSSLDDSKRKITSSARIGLNLSPHPSTFFKSADPVSKTSLVFMGAIIILHQLTWQINVERIPFSQ